MGGPRGPLKGPRSLLFPEGRGVPPSRLRRARPTEARRGRRRKHNGGRLRLPPCCPVGPIRPDLGLPHSPFAIPRGLAGWVWGGGEFTWPRRIHLRPIPCCTRSSSSLLSRSSLGQTINKIQRTKPCRVKVIHLKSVCSYAPTLPIRNTGQRSDREGSGCTGRSPGAPQKTVTPAGPPQS